MIGCAYMQIISNAASPDVNTLAITMYWQVLRTARYEETCQRSSAE